MINTRLVMALEELFKKDPFNLENVIFTIDAKNGRIEVREGDIAQEREEFLQEEIEDLELNRFIEIGYQVKMIKLSNKSMAVDTKSDLIKVNKMNRDSIT